MWIATGSYKDLCALCLKMGRPLTFYAKGQNYFAIWVKHDDGSWSYWKENDDLPNRFFDDFPDAVKLQNPIEFCPVGPKAL